MLIELADEQGQTLASSDNWSKATGSTWGGTRGAHPRRRSRRALHGTAQPTLLRNIRTTAVREYFTQVTLQTFKFADPLRDSVVEAATWAHYAGNGEEGSSSHQPHLADNIDGGSGRRG